MRIVASDVGEANVFNKDDILLVSRFTFNLKTGNLDTMLVTQTIS